MSQDQPQRPEQGQARRDPIKYGDVFDVSGHLTSKPIAPQDAAMMQTAETMIIGQTQKGGPAAVMQFAATRNERACLVGHRDASDVAVDQGVTVTETDLPGERIITEAVAGQVVGQYVEPSPAQHVEPAAVAELSAITIGEALEAAVLTAEDKPVEQSDVAAIQAAEVRATSTNVIIPGGLAASAQSAAGHNERVDRDEDKIKLGDVLTGVREAAGRQGGDEARRRRGGECGTEKRPQHGDAAWRCGGLGSHRRSTQRSLRHKKSFGEEVSRLR